MVQWVVCGLWVCALVAPGKLARGTVPAAGLPAHVGTAASECGTRQSACSTHLAVTRPDFVDVQHVVVIHHLGTGWCLLGTHRQTSKAAGNVGDRGKCQATAAAQCSRLTTTTQGSDTRLGSCIGNPLGWACLAHSQGRGTNRPTHPQSTDAGEDHAYHNGNPEQPSSRPQERPAAVGHDQSSCDVCVASMQARMPPIFVKT